MREMVLTSTHPLEGPKEGKVDIS